MSGHSAGKPRWRWMSQAPLSRASRILVPAAAAAWAACMVAWLAGAATAYRVLLPPAVLLAFLAAGFGVIDTVRHRRDRPCRPSGGA